MHRLVFIYVLKCPLTGNIRYVGKTTNLKRRLENHVAKAKGFASSRKVYNWVQSVLAKGERPVIEEIEACDHLEWPVREMFWIAHYRAIGCDLCNLTDGGESNNGYTATEETKLLQSMVQKQRHQQSPASDETKIAIAKTLSRKVICTTTNEIFESMKKAIKMSGVPRSTFHRRMHKQELINGRKYEWYNQQPPHLTQAE